MNLSPIQYRLEEYELPEECYVDGTLYIEIDAVDGNPYIYSFELSIANDVTQRVVKYEYEAGSKNNHSNATELCNHLHKDKKLMDDIFDECAREGMWDE
jgi:hypothetical protein